MNSNKLIIVFAKNLIEGRVKTRLAKDIGNFTALEVYKELLKVTELATSNSGIDTWVFYSKELDNLQWQDSKKFIQVGDDLGEKMKNAFKEGFKADYNSIVLIGSDLPDMDQNIISKAFSELENQQAVFGPAEDGGYYLIGLNAMVEEVFIDKPWSRNNLLEKTLQELHEDHISTGILGLLNDIDTIEDLKSSGFLEKNEELARTIALLND